MSSPEPVRSPEPVLNPVSSSGDRSNARRLRSLAYAGLVLGGGLAAITAAQPWFRAVGQDVAVAITGVQSTAGLSQALAVVTLAGALLVLVLQARGRRLVAVLLGLVGASIVLVGVLRVEPSSEAVLTQVREVSLADQFALNPTPWAWVYAVAGALVVAGAVLTATTAHRWPTRVDRFARDPAPARPVAVTDEPADVWKALDAGMDPTVDPDVRHPVPGDTMGEVPDSRESPRPSE